MSKTKNTPWTLDAVLEAWGLRVSGASLKNPLKESTGGNSSALDDEFQAMQRVERMPGYSRAKPVLHWHHVLGNRLDQFQPGIYTGYPTGTAGAFVKLGWDGHRHVPIHVAAQDEYDDFIEALEADLRACPFVPIHEIDGEEIDDTTSGKAVNDARSTRDLFGVGK